MSHAYLVRGAVGPNFGAVAAAGALARIVGALLTMALIAATGMLVVCAAVWAISSNAGSWHTAARARTGVLVAAGGAALTGAALAWANWLLHTGASL
jgi:hypothetical protein